MPIVQYAKCSECGSWPGSQHKSFCLKQYEPAPKEMLEKAKQAEGTPTSKAPAWLGLTPEQVEALADCDVRRAPSPQVEVFGAKAFQETLQKAAPPKPIDSIDALYLDGLTQQERIDLLAKPLAASLEFTPCGRRSA